MENNKTVTSSSQVNLKKMSRESGIPIEEIEEAFTRIGTVSTVNRNTIQNSINAVKKQIIPVINIVKSVEEQRLDFEKKLQNLRDRIVAASTAEEALDLYNESDSATNEELLAYNKLIELIAKEVAETSDYDTLKTLLEMAPTGESSDFVESKMYSVVCALVQSVNDLTEIEDLYDNAVDTNPEIDVILNKAVELCKDQDDVETALGWFPDNHIAGDRLRAKLKTILLTAIQNETDADEVKSIYESTKDELVEAACFDRLLVLVNDFDSALDVRDFVPDGSIWWHEAVRKMIEYADADELDDFIEDIYEGTELYSLARKKEEMFLLQKINDSNDWSDVKEIYEEDTYRFSENEQIAFDKLLQLSESFEEISDVYDIAPVGSLEEQKVITKWDQEVLKKLADTSDIDLLEELYEKSREGSVASKQVLLKIISLTENADEAEDAYNFCKDFADIMKVAFEKMRSFDPSRTKVRFNAVTPTPMNPIVSEEDIQEEKTFKTVSTLDNAYSSWSSAKDLREKVYYASKVEEYITPQIEKANSFHFLKSLYSKSIPGSLHQANIIVKIAADFKKKSFFSFLFKS